MAFTTPLTPEILVPRIGHYLVDKGVITQAQLDLALLYQEEKRRQGEPKLIGQVLLELGMIDRDVLDQATAEQIFQYQIALQEHNQQLEKRVRERTAQLQNALTKLSELNQIKSNFIANISHELRTPLTHVKGYLELLTSDSMGPLNEQQISALQVIQKSSERLERLIEDLIQFSLAEKGDFTLNIAPVEINKVIASVVESHRQQAAERGITLIEDIPDQSIKVLCDEEKTTWVILQLVDNAIKFSPSHSKVTILVELEKELAKIAVIDTGIGIQSSRLEEIFEPFHQLDGSATRKYGGTGLGLALVKQIIEAHGSIIHVESELEKGSRFEFVLPVAVQEE